MSKHKIKENPSVKDLLARVQEQHEKKSKEAEKIRDEVRRGIIEAMEAEEKLKQKIKVERTQAESMVLEYDKLYEKESARILEETEKQSISKKDVQDGKASLSQFQLEGKQDEEIAETARTQAMEEMEKASDAIRDLKKRILENELKLCDIRLKIYSLSTQPARIMMETYKSNLDWLQYEFGLILKDGSKEQYQKKQKKHELSLAETGVSVDGGQAWRNITAKKARGLIHNPIMRKELIPILLEQLNNLGNEAAMVTVTLVPVNHPFPGPSIIVRKEG